MKKLRMMAVIMMASVLFIPSVFAAEEYSKVEDITSTGIGKDTYGEAIEGDTKDSNVTTTFDITSKDLMVIDEAKGVETARPVEDATWFGIGVKAPTTVTSLSDPKWEKLWETASDKKTVNAEKDGKNKENEDIYTLWIPFTASELEAKIKEDGENAVVEKTAVINWDGTHKQTIIVRLHASKVTLTIDPDEESTGKIKEGSDLTTEKIKAAVEEYKKAHTTTTQPEERQETNPDTADINLLSLLALILASGFGLTYSVKKVRQN